MVKQNLFAEYACSRLHIKRIISTLEMRLRGFANLRRHSVNICMGRVLIREKNTAKARSRSQAVTGGRIEQSVSWRHICLSLRN